MFESLTFKEKPRRNKPTFDKKGFEPFEIGEIAILSNGAIKVIADDAETAREIRSALLGLMRGKSRMESMRDIAFEDIEYTPSSNVFVIKGNAKAFIELLARTSYLSDDFKNEILADKRFQEIMSQKSPVVGDVLAQLRQIYEKLPAEGREELVNGVAAFPQQIGPSHNQRKSPLVK